MVRKISSILIIACAVSQILTAGTNQNNPPPGTYDHAKEKMKDAWDATKEASYDAYQATKTKTVEASTAAKDAVVSVYQTLKDKIAKLATITSNDVNDVIQSYKDAFTDDQKKDADFKEIFEWHFKIADKKARSHINQINSDVKKYDVAKEKERQATQELKNAQQQQADLQQDMRYQLNEVSVIYQSELDTARRAAELIRKKAQDTREPIKKVIQEEIYVLRKEHSK